MSTKTGTATDYLNLLSILRTFLTTDATLVGLGQQWTEIETNATPYTVNDAGQINTVDFESYLVGPGLSGTETIYVNIQAYHNVPGDIYNWRIKGAIGHLTLGGANTFFTQPNGSPSAFMPFWNQPMTYWIVANGQRFIVVAKVATVYESGYFGKMLPYGTPSQYPLPLVISGASGEGIGGYGDGYLAYLANIRYSAVANHACFFDPYMMYWLDVNNAWRVLGNWFTNTHASGAGADSTWPYFFDDGDNISVLETNLDGSYPLFPIRLEIGGSSGALPAALGELDGAFASTGFASSSESAITVSSDTYYLFQNAFHTSKENYFALKWA
jgi:hypothetical protein